MNEITNLALDALEGNKDLTDEEKLLVSAKMLGYKKMPVDIETFIEDPFYLGNSFGDGKLFPYWKQKLKEVFPTPIHINKMIVILTGAIGTGKSTFSRICSLYLQHRFDCLEDPYKTLGIAPGKYLNFVFFHTTVVKAKSDFIDPNNVNKKDSPYFNGGMLHPDLKVADVADGVRSNATIGGDTVFEVLSELNFVDQTVGKYKIEQAIKRIQSRFLKVMGYFILIILDTSARGDNSLVDNFIKSNPFVGQVMTIRAAIWQARAHLNLYGRKGWFYVYAGDKTHQPYIMKHRDDITMEMDPSRVIKAPEELRATFEFNIVEGLQDHAGVSTMGTGRLFDDSQAVEKQFCLPMYSSDIIIIDFFNKTDKLIYQLDRYLKDIPTDRVVFPRYDLGVTGDNAGLAVTYFDRYVFFDKEKKVRMPVYKTPLMVAISRRKNQETSLYHLYEFILDLNDRFDIGEFTADQFASRQMLQDLEREGLTTRLLSVDRTDAPYIYFKNMVMNKLWTGAENKLALKECCELEWKDEKVDHPKTGSKDVMDAVCGSVYSCFENLEIAEISTKRKIEDHCKWMDNRSEKFATDTFQDMLGGLYGGN